MGGTASKELQMAQRTVQALSRELKDTRGKLANAQTQASEVVTLKVGARSP